MLANHDPFTHPMCDRLKSTCIGLGLVRLLQDAKRFTEARATLQALENSLQGVALDEVAEKTCQANRLNAITKTAVCGPASIRADVAEVPAEPSSIA